MAKTTIEGYTTKKEANGQVSLHSHKTGKTYHEPSVAAAKKLAHMHEVFEHMGKRDEGDGGSNGAGDGGGGAMGGGVP